MSSFSADAARALAGPDWLRDRRVAAAERFAAWAFPTPDEEIWRYSRIAELDIDRYAPAPAVATITGPVADVRGTEPAHAPAAAEDVFDELNLAFAEPVVVRIPAGRTLAEPIVLDYEPTTSGAALFPSLVIEAGADAEVTVVQRFHCADDVDVLIVPTVEIHLAASARVKYLGINMLGRRAWMIANQRVVGERDSVATVANVSLGGDYARPHRRPGRGHRRRDPPDRPLLRRRHPDARLPDPAAAHGAEDLVGPAVQGCGARHVASVYTGLIRINPDAKGTVAYQTNRNLTLSKGAWAKRCRTSRSRPTT